MQPLTSIQRADREAIKPHTGFTLWFTGLSGSGKSTLACALETLLNQAGLHTFLIDGDILRTGLCQDLGFSAVDRQENIRRVAELAHIFRQAGVINLVACISPFRQDREFARSLAKEDDFIEIFVDCPLATCEQRDVKGLYAQARQGLIPEFTGISSPYEAPLNPELHLQTDQTTLTQCLAQILQYLQQHTLIPASINAR